MKVVIQRVSEASVTLEGKLYSSIGKGMLLLIGIQTDDTEEDIEWLTSNCSIKEKDGDILAVSQFTLMARVKKGNRPSYIDAARPETAIPLYEKFIQALSLEIQKEIKTGVFGADMKVHLLNDGPVTILIDSKNRI